MSYEPTTWETGDTITAVKLNNMESGISAANSGAEPLIVTVTVTTNDSLTTYTANKSFNDVKTAFLAGKSVVFVTEETYQNPDEPVFTYTDYGIVTEVSTSISEDHSDVDYRVIVSGAVQFSPIDSDPEKNLSFSKYGVEQSTPSF